MAGRATSATLRGIRCMHTGGTLRTRPLRIKREREREMSAQHVTRLGQMDALCFSHARNSIRDSLRERERTLVSSGWERNSELGLPSPSLDASRIDDDTTDKVIRKDARRARVSRSALTSRAIKPARKLLGARSNSAGRGGEREPEASGCKNAKTANRPGTVSAANDDLFLKSHRQRTVTVRRITNYEWTRVDIDGHTLGRYQVEDAPSSRRHANEVCSAIEYRRSAACKGAVRDLSSK